VSFGKRLEIVIWMGISKGQDQPRGTGALVCCERGSFQPIRCVVVRLIRSLPSQVLEETGYNLAGKVNPEDVIQVSIREQKISLYIVPDVPEDFEFETRTRKEISVSDFWMLRVGVAKPLNSENRVV
jgi:hypothetical protein